MSRSYLLSGFSQIFRKPFANVYISRKVPFAQTSQIYACGPRLYKTFHGFLHDYQIAEIASTLPITFHNLPTRSSTICAIFIYRKVRKRPKGAMRSPIQNHHWLCDRKVEPKDTWSLMCNSLQRISNKIIIDIHKRAITQYKRLKPTLYKSILPMQCHTSWLRN